jgi:hypothetical protein
MKKILFVAALTFVAVGCKKKNDKGEGAGSASAAPVAAAGATCTQAIDNSMALSKDDMAKMPGFTPELADKMKALGISRCESDKWSPEAIKCMADAKAMPDSQACYDKLTQDQQDKMNKAAGELLTPPAGSGSAPAPEGSAAGSGSGSAAAGSGSN